MRASISMTVALAAAMTAAAAWAGWKDPVQEIGAQSQVFKTAAGAEIRVDAVATDVFRIRVKRGDVWTESAMNRYATLEKPAAPKAVEKTADGLKTESAAIAFADGKLRFTSTAAGADVSVEPKLAGDGFEVRFSLTADERVFGLGDVSRENLQRRPGRYEVWVKNMTCYIPIPAAFMSTGWGVLVNTGWRNFFDVGVKEKDALICEAPKGDLDVYVFCGKGYRGLLDAYTRLTGRPSLLPIWGYGFTYVCNTGIDRFFLMTEAREMRREHLPCDVIGLEPGWMEKNYDFSTRKEWHKERFGGDMKYYSIGSHTWSAALDRMGYKLSLWLCCQYDLFRYEEQCAAGTARKMGRQPDLPQDITENWVDDRIETGKAGGEVTGFGGGKPKRGELEKQFKEGELPWFEHLKKFVDQGAKGFKLDGSCQVTDWNGIPNRKWSNGMDNEEAHNLYPLVYGKQMALGFEEYTQKRAMVYSAGGYAGIQKYVATWAGDTGGGLKTLASVLNLGMTGHPNQSSDTNVLDPASLHYGFLSPWTEHNNWGAWRQAWYQDDEKIDQFRFYDLLRYRLLPYIYTTAGEAYRTGWPIARSLAFCYPDVRAYDNLVTTYMLGPHLLVSAFAKETELPAGVWHDWLTDKAFTGPAKVPFAAGGLLGGGLFVRAGAIVPMWPKRVQHVERGWSNQVDFHVWPDADGEGELFEDDGRNLDYRKGKYARVPLFVKKTATGAVFTVGRRHGTDANTFVTPGKPDYRAVFHTGAKPASATLDGQAVDGVWDAEAKTLTVTLGAVPVNGCKVGLVF